MVASFWGYLPSTSVSLRRRSGRPSGWTSGSDCGHTVHRFFCLVFCVAVALDRSLLKKAMISMRWPKVDRVIIIQIAKNPQYLQKRASWAETWARRACSQINSSEAFSPFSCARLNKLLSISCSSFSLAGAQAPQDLTEGVSFSLTPRHGRACEGGDFSCRIWPGFS